LELYLHSQYAFKASCSVKAQGQLYFIIPSQEDMQIQKATHSTDVELRKRRRYWTKVWVVNSSWILAQVL
jgi:hypothetical protein